MSNQAWFFSPQCVSSFLAVLSNECLLLRQSFPQISSDEQSPKNFLCLEARYAYIASTAMNSLHHLQQGQAVKRHEVCMFSASTVTGYLHSLGCQKRVSLSDGAAACRTNSSSSVSLGSVTRGPRMTESNAVILEYTGEMI
jgi:hypothetical protein